MKDVWKPDQYEKFKNQRAQPFWDLLNLTRSGSVRSVIDLGCGTGKLTNEMLSYFPEAEILGVDNSAAMLKDTSCLETERLRFELADISTFSPPIKYDLVFSNATLQWLPNHEDLFPKILSWVSDHGQVAVQMPFNFDHPSHQTADQVAQGFEAFKGKPPVLRTLLPMERYAAILFQAGFRDITCRIETYFHPMDSGKEVVEWTKGTLLTSYEKTLSKEDFATFVQRYEAALTSKIGTGPYLYLFKRLLLAGKRP